MKSDALISFQDVGLGYGHRTVLYDLNFNILRGDYVGIVGPNGAGKTTLLKSILGVLKPLRGEIRYYSDNSQNGRRPDLHFGYVPQRQNVDEFFPLTVLDVVLMGRYARLGPLRRPGRSDRDGALRALEQMGIPHLERRPYRELSGGQKQRALIARALLAEPSVLLLDEPTSDMDLTSERAIMELVDKLQRDQGLTVLIVTHLLQVVANHAHRIAIINNGQVTLGESGEILSDESLTELYGVPVRVADVHGKRVIV